MAEVAATVAGIISLGIQLCNGLITYYSAYGNADQAIQSMLDALHDLTKTLVLISSRLSDSSHLSTDTRHRVEESVLACETSLVKLERKLSKVSIISQKTTQSNSPTGGKIIRWNAALVNAGRRASYPMKESTIIKMKELCNDCRDDLQLALEVLSIDLATLSLNKIDDLNTQLVEVSQGVRNVKAEIKQTGEGMRTLLVHQEDAATIQAIEWLSPLHGTFQRRQQDHFSTKGRQDRSGIHLVNDPNFQEWAVIPGSILWCIGAPGIGKTVTASYIINYLQHITNQGTIAIAYVYCSYKDTERENTLNLLSSILQQLLTQDRPNASIVLDLFQSHVKQKTRPTVPEIMDLLQVVIGAFSRTYIVIDALDECSDLDGNRDDFVTELTSLLPDICLLIISRPLPHLEYALISAVRIELTAQDEDIIEYVKERVAISQRLHGHVRKDPGLIHTISQKILRKVKGMFLMARLYLDSLSKLSTLRKIKEALDTLPDGLIEVYDDCISRIRSQGTEDAAVAMRALHWIYHAARPLTVSEMQCALAIQVGDQSLDHDGEPDKDLLLSVCCGLIVVETETDTIALVHYTAQEYLRERSADLLAEGQLDLTRTCLTHLLFTELSNGPNPNDGDLEQRLVDYPLLQYASRYWGVHIAQCEHEMPEAAADLAVRLLMEQQRVEMIWQISEIPEFKLPGYSQNFARKINGLSLAASMGLAHVLKMLLAIEVNRELLHVQDSDGRAAIHHAIMRKGNCNQIRSPVSMVTSRARSWEEQNNGVVDVIDLLIGAGSSLNIVDGAGQTPLHYAAAFDRTATISKLVSAGASDSIAVLDGYHGTPLYRAVESGHDASVRMLLDLGSDIYVQNSYNQTLLHRAAEENHISVLKTLVDRVRVDKGEEELRRFVNVKDWYGWTAKYRAADQGHTEITKLLTTIGGRQNSRPISKPAVLHSKGTPDIDMGDPGREN